MKDATGALALLMAAAALHAPWTIAQTREDPSHLPISAAVTANNKAGPLPGVVLGETGQHHLLPQLQDRQIITLTAGPVSKECAAITPDGIDQLPGRLLVLVDELGHRNLEAFVVPSQTAVVIKDVTWLGTPTYPVNSAAGYRFGLRLEAQAVPGYADGAPHIMAWSELTPYQGDLVFGQKSFEAGAVFSTNNKICAYGQVGGLSPFDITELQVHAEVVTNYATSGMSW